MERAQELFLKYSGNRFHMDREGDGAEYDGYHVSKETEEMWAQEHIAGFLTSEMRGREALRAYSAATELSNSGGRDDSWCECLYYPLRAGHLDDVTVLYMLPCSLRMAERAAKKNRFSREEAEAYLGELEDFARLVQARTEEETLTRASDYAMQEFSDPVYISDYLNDLKKKWAGLLR